MTLIAFPTLPTAPVTQAYGNKNKMYASGVHRGIDYGVAVGSPVYACMSGRVVIASAPTNTGYGRHIRIEHPDGSVSIYGHLAECLVLVGGTVNAGELIGRSGGDPRDGIDGDGFSTGAHLHFEIRPPNAITDQDAVDPVEYLLRNKTGIIIYEYECIASIGLNVRSAVSSSAPVLRALKFGEQVYIEEAYVNGWMRLHALRPEYCYGGFLKPTGNVINKVDDPMIEISADEKLSRLWAAHPELHRGEQ